jgi:hypothetical protein
MTFIKKIFTQSIDENVHKSFTRFSKGEFPSRAVSKVVVAKNDFKVSFSYDLVKDVILLIASAAEKVDAAGKIIQGKKKTEINATMSAQELKKLCEKNDFVLLDIASPSCQLKVKKSLPKPGKGLDEKFASATLPIRFLKEFVFEYGQPFKKAHISHTFTISDIIIPEEYKNNLEQARIHAKRKGKIIRALDVDGKQQTSECEFIV